MVEETYSAGLISQSFWFVEMKKVIKLIDDGKSEEEIKKMCIEENLFGAAKEYRAKRIYGYIWNRAKRLNKTLFDLFCTSDLATQKVINLIAILRSDRLFFEFMFEVYQEKNILGILIIEDADVNIFFKNKEIQNEDKLEVIDGQQRLTTLMLLLRAFYSKFGHMQDKASISTKQNIEKCLWKTDEFGDPDMSQLKIDSEVATDNDKEEFLEILRTGIVNKEMKSKYACNFRFFQNNIDEFLSKYPTYFAYLPTRSLVGISE